MTDDNLRTMVDLRDRVLQKTRIGFGNRLDAIKRGDDIATDIEIKSLQMWHERFLQLEKYADADIKRMAKKYEIIEYMIAVKGIGLLLAAKVVSMIDIKRSPNVSSLWRYAGYAVIDGKSERPVKGQKLAYNKRLKTTCYLVSQSFLRANSPYRKVYDSAREYYDANRADWSDGHKHNAAMRKMVKMWLSHLWLVWRLIEGLEVSAPYVHEKLGHVHNYTPQEFGWPEIEAVMRK